MIGINNSPAKTVGFYIDNAGRTSGFEARGGVFMKVNFPGQPFNGDSPINSGFLAVPSAVQ